MVDRFSLFENEIRDAAKRQILEHERHVQRIYDENLRRTRRSTKLPQLLVAGTPERWSLAPGFNPYHVKKRYKTIAYTIMKSFKTYGYEPRDPAIESFKKPAGGERLLRIHQIADEVVSGRTYRNLLAKNRPLMSSHSYAYRNDVSGFDALAHIESEWFSKQRLYVAEYDFTRFFDTISHDYLWKIIRDYHFRLTPIEMHIVHSFLVRTKPLLGSVAADDSVTDGRGIPQGTSISLFLANIAVVQLDRKLEELGVGFTRYADDTLIWSNSYDKIARAADVIYEIADKLKSPINQSKSAGIRLLTREGMDTSEIRGTHAINYLSHELQLGKTKLKVEVAEKIISDISKMIYDHLLREPINDSQSSTRLTRLDRDYVAYIWQLRRYIYGHMSEVDVRRSLADPSQLQRFTGILSRFAYVKDENQLEKLDQVIRTRTWLALQKRKRLLRPALSLALQPVPWSLDQYSLYNYRGVSGSTNQIVDLRLPSILRMAELMKQSIALHGNQILGRDLPLYLYSR